MPHNTAAKRKAYKALYWKANRCELSAKAKIWRRKNKKRYRTKQKCWTQENREHVNACHRKWWAANRKKLQAQARARYLKNRQGLLTRSRNSYAKAADKGKRHGRKYPSATRKPPNACECCKRRVLKRRLSLDHCHDSKKFRGWLCAQCNVGIGMLGDSVKGLRQGIAYLKRARKSR